MLTSMRKGAGTWVAKGFLFLLVMSFAVWGIQGYVGGPVEVTVAEVGGVEITGTEFRTELQRQMRRLQNQFGQAIDPEQARALGIYESALQQIIARRVIDQTTDDLGLAVSDDVVRQDIRANPAFRDTFGGFDRLRFQQVIGQNGWTEQTYVAIARRDLARRQLVESVLAGADAAPEVLVDRVYRYRREARLADYIVLPNERIVDIAEPDEAALAAYHEENAGQFTAPEFRALSYVTLAPADLIEQVHVAEADMRDEYDARIDEFVQPERRQLTQMVFDTEARAQEALSRLQTGQAMAAVAKDMLGQESTDLALGLLARDDLPDELGDTAFAVDEGEFTNPVKTDFGWHIIRVDEVQDGGTRTFEEVQEELRDAAALRLAGEILYDRANELEDVLAGGASFAETVQQADLAVQRLEAVDRNGRDAAGRAIADLPPIRNFLAIAFDNEVGDEPELHESDGAVYFMIRVDRIDQSRLKRLDEVRDAVVAKWRADQQDSANATLAAQLVERIKGGASLSEIAGELGLQVASSSPMIRTGRGAPAIPAALQAALFDLPVGGPATAADNLGGAHIVARLTEVREADPQADRNLTDRLSTQLATAIAGDILEQYRTALETVVGVTIDREAVAIATASN